MRGAFGHRTLRARGERVGRVADDDRKVSKARRRGDGEVIGERGVSGGNHALRERFAMVQVFVF